MKIWGNRKKLIQTRLFDKAPAGVSVLQKQCRPVSEVLKGAGEEMPVDREVAKTGYPVFSDDSSWNGTSSESEDDF